MANLICFDMISIFTKTTIFDVSLSICPPLIHLPLIFQDHAPFSDFSFFISFIFFFATVLDSRHVNWLNRYLFLCIRCLYLISDSKNRLIVSRSILKIEAGQDNKGRRVLTVFSVFEHTQPALVEALSVSSGWNACQHLTGIQPAMSAGLPPGKSWTISRFQFRAYVGKFNPELALRKAFFRHFPPLFERDIDIGAYF